MRFSSAIVVALAAAVTAQIDAVKVVSEIAPNAKDCADKTECRTAEEAAPYIADSMAYYKIYNANEIAAIVSHMAFESVEFKYKHNVFPERPGQGTANMQLPKFNLMYAQSIDALKDKVKDITTVEGASNETLNKVLSLVTPDEYNFGSGPWFYSTQCKQDVKDAFKKTPYEGFAAYMECVDIEVTDERKAYFTRALKAFNLSRANTTKY
ncbi:hypothetical protein NOR_03559 [Metarhizium rileyi]|uniref:Uncharacterized protein n=1 Tax=Metarhizium rileyi (strain RCEF 4871) TaxID=1649241 RepID=A0A167F508_METRR|nr:hypothetical protein NOR_03559 [Metarhizium rileyi RCEF 4871]